MPGMYCAISGCRRCANADVGISFHSVPTNPRRKKQWDDAVGVTLPPRGRVCSDHFRAFDYLPFSHSKERLRHRLKSTAVPSVSLHHSGTVRSMIVTSILGHRRRAGTLK
ncbi:hypothetical protein HPB50_027852 [Hyalomma asiaticum]|nr:hypothetical protein HPB50_027852 [Hyalomma asiaticum]